MYVPRAMNSFRMSFCSVPSSRRRSTPCSSPTTTYIASRIGAVALMVIEVETLSSGISWNSRSRSSTVSIATPARPTSPSAIAWSESYPIWVGRSNATDSPVCPAAKRWRKRAFVCSAVPKPAVGVLRVGGIEEDAARDEVAVEIRDQRPDVAGVLGLDPPLAVLEGRDDPLHRGSPAIPVALVHAVVLPHGGGRDVGMRQQELADRGVEGEAVHPLTRRVHEHRARAVEAVARGDLLLPCLQTVGDARRGALPGHATMDREHRADRDLDVDVGGAVEGVVQHDVLAGGPPGRDGDGLLILLRRRHAHPPRVLDAVAHGLVGEEIELLLQVAGDVHRARRAEDVGEPGAAHVAGDDLRGEAEVVQQVRQLPRRLRVEPLLLHDETLNRDDFGPVHRGRPWRR